MRVKRISAIVALTIVGLVGVIVSIPAFRDANNKFWRDIVHALVADGDRVFIQDITEFEWDIVCVLPPYALDVGPDKDQRIKSYIRGDLAEFAGRLPVQDHDGAWIFAFVKDGRVVRIEQKGRRFYLRANYQDNCIQRQHAAFRRDGEYVFVTD